MSLADCHTLGKLLVRHAPAVVRLRVARNREGVMEIANLRPDSSEAEVVIEAWGDIGLIVVAELLAADGGPPALRQLTIRCRGPAGDAGLKALADVLRFGADGLPGRAAAPELLQLKVLNLDPLTRDTGVVAIAHAMHTRRRFHEARSSWDPHNWIDRKSRHTAPGRWMLVWRAMYHNVTYMTR